MMAKTNFLHIAAMHDDATAIDVMREEDVRMLFELDEMGRAPLQVAALYGATAASIALMEKTLELCPVAD
jgi:hypothetical protein